MNGNANLNANNLTPQNVIDWRKKLNLNFNLLWENNNPNVNFNSDIELLNDNYDFLLFVYNFSINSDFDKNTCMTEIVEKGKNARFQINGATFNGFRALKYQNNKKYSSESCLYNNKTNYSYMIPLKIYGIKTF